MTPEEADEVIKIIDKHIRYLTDLINELKEDYKKKIDRHLDGMQNIMTGKAKDIVGAVNERMATSETIFMKRVNELEAKIFLLEKKIG